MPRLEPLRRGPVRRRGVQATRCAWRRAAALVRAVAAGLVLSVLTVSSALLAGCGKSDADAVKVRLDGAYLVVENHSGRDVHALLLADPTAAFVPVSSADNRVQDGRFRRWRVAPSQRGTTVHVAWWHPGRAAEGTDLPGADRVRRVPLVLQALSAAPPFDEQVVTACVAALRLSAQARGRPPTESELETTCMKEADECLNTHGMNCEVQARHWKARLAQEQARTQAPR